MPLLADVTCANLPDLPGLAWRMPERPWAPGGGSDAIQPNPLQGDWAGCVEAHRMICQTHKNLASSFYCVSLLLLSVMEDSRQAKMECDRAMR